MSAVPPLSVQETALLQAISNAGLVYLLMLRLKRPVGAREVADILGLHEQTAARHLRRLSQLNLVARSGRKESYVLLGDSQLVLGEIEQSKALPGIRQRLEPGEKQLELKNNAPAMESIPDDSADHPADTTKFSQYPPHSESSPVHALDSTGLNLQDRVDQSADDPEDTTKFSQYPPRSESSPVHALNSTVHNIQDRVDDSVDQPVDITKFSQYPINNNINNHDSDINLNNDINDSSELLLLTGETTKNSQYGVESEYADVWQELFAAGINRNQRTRALVCQPHITAEYVRLHRLRQEACGRSGPKWAGLLVTILESGEPAPDINPNGHLPECDCSACHGYRIGRSWEDF